MFFIKNNKALCHSEERSDEESRSGFNRPRLNPLFLITLQTRLINFINKTTKPPVGSILQIELKSFSNTTKLKI